jgi:hypothetical protein
MFLATTSFRLETRQVTAAEARDTSEAKQPNRNKAEPSRRIRNHGQASNRSETTGKGSWGWGHGGGDAAGTTQLLHGNVQIWLPLMGEGGHCTRPAKQLEASLAAAACICMCAVVCPVDARSGFTSRLGSIPCLSVYYPIPSSAAEC